MLFTSFLGFLHILHTIDCLKLNQTNFRNLLQDVSGLVSPLSSSNLYLLWSRQVEDIPCSGLHSVCILIQANQLSRGSLRRLKPQQLCYSLLQMQQIYF